MNETYLTLQGWIPHRLDIDGSVGLFLYNPHTHTIINRKSVIYNEDVGPEAYKIVDLKIVSFSDIPIDIINQAMSLNIIENTTNEII